MTQPLKLVVTSVIGVATIIGGLSVNSVTATADPVSTSAPDGSGGVGDLSKHWIGPLVFNGYVAPFQPFRAADTSGGGQDTPYRAYSTEGDAVRNAPKYEMPSQYNWGEVRNTENNRCLEVHSTDRVRSAVCDGNPLQEWDLEIVDLGGGIIGPALKMHTQNRYLAPDSLGDAGSMVAAAGKRAFMAGPIDEISAITPLHIDTPAPGSTETTKRPEFSGTGDEGATISIVEGGTSIASTRVSGGRWSIPSDVDLADGTHTVTVTQTPVVGAASSEQVTFDVKTAAPIAPLTIDDPADGSTVSNPTTAVRFSGTGEPDARVVIQTQGPNPRTVIDTTVEGNGTWTKTGDLMFDVHYVLDTIYTAPGESPVNGLYHVTNTASHTVAPSNVTRPAEGSTVSAPDKQVPIDGTATTGTVVTIWNWSAKDRIVAEVVTADGTGRWSTVATLNNTDTPYALFVEYEKDGTTTSQTRNVTVTGG